MLEGRTSQLGWVMHLLRIFSNFVKNLELEYYLIESLSGKSAAKDIVKSSNFINTLYSLIDMISCFNHQHALVNLSILLLHP